MGRIDHPFTGDGHAVTAAHDLVVAMLDAHRHHGTELGIDPDGTVRGLF